MTRCPGDPVTRLLNDITLVLALQLRRLPCRFHPGNAQKSLLSAVEWKQQLGLVFIYEKTCFVDRDLCICSDRQRRSTVGCGCCARESRQAKGQSQRQSD